MIFFSGPRQPPDNAPGQVPELPPADMPESSPDDTPGSLAPEQPDPERWRVLFDPAGHPFCLTTQIPSEAQ